MIRVLQQKHWADKMTGETKRPKLENKASDHSAHLFLVQWQVNILTLHFHPQLKGEMERGERSCISRRSMPAGPSESGCGWLIDSLASQSNYKLATCLYFGSSVHIYSHSTSSLASWQTCGMLRSASGFKFIFSFAVADTGINTGEKHTHKHTWQVIWQSC